MTGDPEDSLLKKFSETYQHVFLKKHPQVLLPTLVPVLDELTTMHRWAVWSWKTASHKGLF